MVAAVIFVVAVVVALTDHGYTAAERNTASNTATAAAVYLISAMLH